MGLPENSKVASGYGKVMIPLSWVHQYKCIFDMFVKYIFDKCLLLIWQLHAWHLCVWHLGIYVHGQYILYRNAYLAKVRQKQTRGCRLMRRQLAPKNMRIHPGLEREVLSLSLSISQIITFTFQGFTKDMRFGPATRGEEGLMWAALYHFHFPLLRLSLSLPLSPKI